MTQFKEPPDNLRDSHPINYAIGKTGSFLVGDLFHASYLTDCLAVIEQAAAVHKLMFANEGVKQGRTMEQIKRGMDHVEELRKWAESMRNEGFHTIHSQVFVSEWAALESGLENIAVAILRTQRASAESAGRKFKNNRFDIAAWPWSEENCLEVAQKLEPRAKQETTDGGWDAYARLVTLFGWLGVPMPTQIASALDFNEASLVRNVIMHRYGRPTRSDADKVPELGRWIDKAIPMTRDRLGRYHQAMVNVFLAIANVIWNDLRWETRD